MMKTTVERLDDSRLRLEVEVPEDTLREAVDETLVYMGREMRIAGFRPGKVPPQAVMARLGREQVVAETVRAHLDHWYRSAVMASGIRPVAQPDIDMPDSTPKSGPFRFSATIEVAPRPKLPELATLEVDKPNVPDLQPYVDRVIDATLKGAGTLADSDQPAAEGDEVVVDFRCTIDDEEILGASATGYQAQIGDGRLLDELEGAIVGTSAGTDVEVAVDFPADHPMEQLAGQHAVFHLTVKEVQRLVLPELTDEVVSNVSEFSTVAELDADIRASIGTRLESEVAGIFRANAVGALADAAEVEVPEALVQSRQQELYAGLKQQLEQAGLSIEQYLDRAGRESHDVFAELETSARDDLRRELVLLALAEETGVQVSEDELRREVYEHAATTGHDPEEAFEQVVSSGRADMLRGELLIQRAIDHLVGTVAAKPVDLPVEGAEPAEPAASDESE